MYTGSFGPASNRADYRETIQLRTTDQDDPPDVEEIEIAIGSGGQCATLRKLLSAGQIIYDEDLGEFSFILTTDELRRFPAGTHDMGIVLTIDGAREQLFAGDIVIVDGIVS
jgi:hypothetical protein